jgi:hypothetical protein
MFLDEEKIFKSWIRIQNSIKSRIRIRNKKFLMQYTGLFVDIFCFIVGVTLLDVPEEPAAKVPQRVVQ